MNHSCKYILRLQVAYIVLALFGCAHHLATIPLVSMTKRESPTKTKKIGPVKQKYCDDEDPIVTTPNGQPALIDEVILRAQKASKADYLQNASLTIWDGRCIEVEAEGLRVL